MKSGGAIRRVSSLSPSALNWFPKETNFTRNMSHSLKEKVHTEPETLWDDVSVEKWHLCGLLPAPWGFSGAVVPISLESPEVLTFLGSEPQSQHLVALLSAVNCVGALLLCWIEGFLLKTFGSYLRPWRVSSICWCFLSSWNEIMKSCLISSF